MLRRSSIALATLTLALAGCSDGADPDPTASPSASISDSTSASTSPSGSPTPTIPAYLEPFTSTERQAYADASRAYDEFTRTTARFRAHGRTTPGVRTYLQKYSSDWTTAWGRFSELANEGVRIVGVPVTLTERPASISASDERGKVVLRRCIDSSKIIVIQDGRKVDQPQLQKHRRVTVEVIRRPGESWWRSGIASQGPTC